MGTYVDIGEASLRHGVDMATLPYMARVLLENLERQRIAGAVDDLAVGAVARWASNIGHGVPLHVERVILPDSSGLPVLQDLAALRGAVRQAGGDPQVVEPAVPVDLIVDHSLQVDRFGSGEAMLQNLQMEFGRNGERYRFLKWAEQAFRSVRVFPPGTGIIHQINLEKISQVVLTGGEGEDALAFPDFVIGCDSHTPMINALGVLGWGVGGLDAEAAMLGQPYVFPIPDFVAVRLRGRIPVGATTTDLALLVTERLRRENVVSCCLEFIGEGAAALSVPERATLANMAPEYGATTGFFPIDGQTIRYLSVTRSLAHAAFVERYARANGLFRSPDAPEPRYSRIVEIDAGAVTRSVAGPRRPQDRLDLRDVPADFRARLSRPLAEGGFAANPDRVSTAEGESPLRHGALAIAAITACTNTSNPAVMIAAGLLARNAIRAGLSVPSFVKTSMAPGSRTVARYLNEFGLLGALGGLGFNIVGYGCTTCGGKSGPLVARVSQAVERDDLVVAAALSGNRNFEGRIHRQVRANYIMSPPLVVAYALAGRIDIDLASEPVGLRPDGSGVMLADLWPSPAEVEALVARAADPAAFRAVYDAPAENVLWEALDAPSGLLFEWDAASTYLVEPPFLALAKAAAASGIGNDLTCARALAVFGDSLTTDHISPGGEIPVDSAAGRYLQSVGVAPASFNTYVARRCNHEVMTRATFANLRIKNLLVPDREGGITRLLPGGDIVGIHDAARAYAAAGVPLIVLAGKEYGTGSSRDWAARGTALLGVKAVIAESYERIHRANLVSMGVLPLRFHAGEGWRAIGLDGTETFSLSGIRRSLEAGTLVSVTARAEGRQMSFTVELDVTTESERDCLRRGGLLVNVLSSLTERGRALAARPQPMMDRTQDA